MFLCILEFAARRALKSGGGAAGGDGARCAYYFTIMRLYDHTTMRLYDHTTILLYDYTTTLLLYDYTTTTLLYPNLSPIPRRDSRLALGLCACVPSRVLAVSSAHGGCVVSGKNMFSDPQPRHVTLTPQARPPRFETRSVWRVRPCVS